MYLCYGKIKSLTFIPILPLNGATNNKQFKNDIKQSRRRVVHQRSKTRVDSTFAQYEFLFKQHCRYFYIHKIRSTAQILHNFCQIM